MYSVAHAFPTFAGEVPLTEYGTYEGVPNRLYFVPHAKVMACMVWSAREHPARRRPAP